ncbi:BspA family leucine-rich repeat surface protein [Enterococcus faecalis]|uniref:BspA family leucine-rich repeat surface protein n=1 Tax=Enterococcus faecalis TaxID=1351 RepID=UPI0018846921|nr:BspA family leucine-rich repeat surface protein [Enterococcus faecalis]MBF0004029.1 BspA family leucine-rich repeat surface protein [Enterococcus faecalis]MBF0006712.1 BspA family leucine-rich repeat surface protein [Enterococcus faecalis]
MKYRKILSTSFATLLLANTGAPVVANATTETKGKTIDQSVLDNVFRTDIDLNAINYTTLTKEEESLQTETIDDNTTSVEEQIENNEVGAVSVEEEPITIEENQQAKNEANSSSTSSIEENNTNEAENSNDTTEEKESDKKTEDTVGNESDENKKDNDIKNSDASDEQTASSGAEKENEPKKEKREMENREAEETGDWGTTTWKAQLQEDGSYLYTVFSGETGSADEAPWKTNTNGTFRIKFDGKVLIKDGTSLFASARLLSLEAENIVCEGTLQVMFYGASNLTSLDLSGWDTSNVTDMEAMFSGANSLTSLDLSGWDTSNVTSMYGMFEGASNLTSLDLSGWDTSNVTSMSGMFEGASSLTSLDLSGFDTSNVTYMYAMFNGASKIKTLKMNNWNMSTWTNLNKLRDGIFQYLPNLETLEAKSWNLQGITDLSYLFSNETSLFYTQGGTLKTANFSGWDTRNVTTMAGMFYGATGLTSLDVSGFNTSKVTSMRYMFYNARSLTSLDISGWNTNKVTEMYSMFSNASKIKTLKMNNWNMSTWTNLDKLRDGIFQYLPNLETLEAKKWNLQGIASLSYLFSRETSLFYTQRETLKTANFSGWDTRNVTTMQAMFDGASSLTSLDVSGFNTSNVTNMYCMFNGASSLTSLDVSGWDTSKVVTMTFMFNRVSNLTNLDVSGFNISNVTAMYAMFSGASSLTSLDVSGWNTSKVTNMNSMFYGASSLTSLDVSGWDTSNVTTMYCMFNGASSLTSLDVSGWDTSNVTTMAGMFYGASSLTSLDVSGWNVNKVTNMSNMFNGARNIVTLKMNNWNMSTWTNLNQLRDGIFKYLPNLETLEAKKWNLQGIASLSYLFSRETSLFYTQRETLKTANFSGWDTRNVTTMQAMFDGASSLTSLDVSGFNTSNVTNMYAMFYGASSLTSLDVSGWDTSKVATMTFMFNGVSNLTNLDVSGFNTSNVTTIYCMFQGASSLTSLDVSGWDTSNMTDMSNMFYGTSSLTSLDVSNWDTSKVTDMSSMFSRASGLTSLDVSSWDTSKVTDMSYMFSRASGLTSLDVSSWDTSKVTTMQSMFSNTSLEKLTLGDNFKFIAGAGLPKPNVNVSPNKSTGKWTREDGQSNSYTPTEFMEKYGTGDLKAGTYVGDISIPFTLSNFSSEATIIGQKVSTSFEIDYENLADNYFENGMMQFAVTGYKLPKEIEYDSVTVSYISGNGSASQIKDVRYDKANNTIYFDITQGTAALVNKIRVSLNGTAWNNTSTTEENHTFVVDYNTDEKGPIENSDLVASISGKVDVNNGNLSFESVPDTLAFKPTKLIVTKEDIIIDRLLSDWNIQVSDWRGTNVLPGTTNTISRQDWDMVATSEEFEDSKGEKVSPTAIGLVYVNEHGDKKELTADQEVLIESHSVDGETPKENHNVTISWGEETGLKTVVKNRNALNSNEEYSARVKYELRVAP